MLSATSNSAIGNVIHATEHISSVFMVNADDMLVTTMITNIKKLNFFISIGIK